jgi:DNA replication protein DnaC
MTAFLKLDRCKVCSREVPWEWVPPLDLCGRPLAGTGVWRSQLIDELCPACSKVIDEERTREHRRHHQRDNLIRLFGGIKPCREFTFERYQVTAGNQRAFQLARDFDPIKDNLYLWGRCGVGKTHLAYAIARGCVLSSRSVAVLKASTLTRKLRMKTPEEEQQGIDAFVRVQVLVMDDLGAGAETAYARQVLREILDARDFRDLGGLVVTSSFSLAGLAAKLTDAAIPSRLAGMCRAVEVLGVDRRPAKGRVG